MKVAWKRLYGDVFRKPKFFLQYAVLVGTGIQVSFLALSSFMFSIIADSGLVSGFIIVLLPFYGFLNGYIASICYKFFKGSEWVKLSLISAVFYPSLVITSYFIVWIFDKNVSESFMGNGGVSLITLSYLWSFINLPSTVFGAIGGFLSEEVKIPTRPNRMSRMIPEQPYFLKNKILVLLFALAPYWMISEQFTLLSNSIGNVERLDLLAMFDIKVNSFQLFPVVIDLLQVIMYVISIGLTMVI